MSVSDGPFPDLGPSAPVGAGFEPAANPSLRMPGRSAMVVGSAPSATKRCSLDDPPPGVVSNSDSIAEAL
jgi:hypothetical protein